MVDDIRRGVWVEPAPKWLDRPAPRFAAFTMEWSARQSLEGGRQGTGLAPKTHADKPSRPWLDRHVSASSSRPMFRRARSPISISTDG